MGSPLRSWTRRGELLVYIRVTVFGNPLIHPLFTHSDMEETDAVTGHRKQNKYVKTIKIIILLFAWVSFTAFLMTNEEKELEYRQLAVPQEGSKQFILFEPPLNPRLAVNLDGAFLSEHAGNFSKKLHVRLKLLTFTQNSTASLAAEVAALTTQTTESAVLYDKKLDPYAPANWSKLVRDSLPGNLETISDHWKIPVADAESLDITPESSRRHVFKFDQAILNKINSRAAAFVIELTSELNVSFPTNFAYDPSPIDTELGIILAAVILLGLYVMIIWELVHRTFAAIIASTMVIGVLALLNERPPMPVLMSWIDVETLLLLFGMMILVAILSETGIFDFLAVYAYKVRGLVMGVEEAGTNLPPLTNLCRSQMERYGR